MSREPAWRRLLRILRNDPAADDEEELRFHREMRTEEFRRRGMGEAAARAAAEERLGDLERVRRDLTELGDPERRRADRREWIAGLVQDLRYGLRTLLRAPAFASMSVLTLALGIGATTAIFSIVWTVLLAPLPYPQPDRLVRVWETSPQGATRNVVSAGNVVDWQTRARSFEVLGAHQSPFPVTLTGDGEASRVVMVNVQPEVFEALGVPVAIGRAFGEEERTGGAVAILGHAFWSGRYGADPDVLGRTLVLNDVPHTVIGVAPEGFAFPSDAVEVYLPLTADDVDPTSRTSHNYSVVARLAPGSTIESAQAEMTGLAARIAEEHPEEMTGWSARVVGLHDDVTRDVGPLFRVLLGGVAVVLLIACGNLANLLLARAVSREKEIALRGALGAGRRRIFRQLLTESALLAALGGLAAALAAPLLLRVLLGTAPSDIALVDQATIDGRMLLFTAATALGCALLFGLAPALRLARSDLESMLRSGRGGSASGHTRLRSGLLVGQVALSVVLLVGAGLFVRSFRALQATELGFDPEGLVLIDLDLPGPRYPETPDQATFYGDLVDRLAAVPGVVEAATTSQSPGAGSGMTFSFAIEGRVAPNPNGREDDETLHAVGPGYFEVLGREIVDGRPFDDLDRADGVPVVIINESLARKHWPDGDAVGQRIAFRVGETPWREIVGVVADARLQSPDVPADPGLFVPYAQKSWSWLTWSTVMVRLADGTDAEAVVPALRSALAELDPELPPQSVGTVTGAFRENTARRRFAMTLVGGFGLLALLLSVVGLYGLIAYSVARQRSEIGVRMALGARAGDVVGRVLRHSLGLTLVGALAGAAIAWWASGAIESLLYGVSPVDVRTYAVTVGLMVAVAALTALVPALRAARIDPVRALRSE